MSDNLDEEFNEILRTATKEELGLLLDLIRAERLRVIQQEHEAPGTG